MLASAGRPVSAKVPRYPPKTNLSGPAFDSQLFLASADLRIQVVKFREKVLVVAQGGSIHEHANPPKGSVILVAFSDAILQRRREGYHPWWR
jgi:hypothetical protein